VLTAYTEIDCNSKPIPRPGTHSAPALYYRRVITACRAASKPMHARKKSAKLLRCPTCGMLVRTADEDFPFCSDRCRKIDLGKWATGV